MKNCLLLLISVLLISGCLGIPLPYPSYALDPEQSENFRKIPVLRITHTEWSNKSPQERMEIEKDNHVILTDFDFTAEGITSIKGKAIRTGDWIRAITLDRKIHEFSFVRLVDEKLIGGDSIITVTQIKDIDVFPLEQLQSGKAFVNDEYFPKWVVLFAENTLDGWLTLYLKNGEIIHMKLPILEQEMLVGTGTGEFDRRTVRVSVDRVARAEDCCGGSIERWNVSEATSLELIKNEKILQQGSWVRITLVDGNIQEFQYRGIENNHLIGGDGSVAYSEIAVMEVYSEVSEASLQEDSSLNAVGIVAIVGFTLLLWGMGIPVPPVVP